MMNPYLEKNRLADVIAAITALATYKKFRVSFEELAEITSNKETEPNHWKIVVSEHPEFFRPTRNKIKKSKENDEINEEDDETNEDDDEINENDGGRTSLLLRKQLPRDFDSKHYVQLTRGKKALLRKNLSKKRYANRITRRPLAISDTLSLIETAIKLHERAIEENKNNRWWIVLGLPFVGALLGTILTNFFINGQG